MKGKLVLLLVFLLLFVGGTQARTRTGQEAADFINTSWGFNVTPGGWATAGAFWDAEAAAGLNPPVITNRNASVQWYPDQLVPLAIGAKTPIYLTKLGVYKNYTIMSLVPGSSLFMERDKLGAVLRITSFAPNEQGQIVKTGVWSDEGKRIG
jgi:hypothetical protein